MSAPWKYEKDRIFIKRLLTLAGIFFLLILVLISRVFYLQILQGDRYRFLADKNRTSIRLTLPSRGNIFDRNGVKIAELGKGGKVVFASFVKEPYDIAVIDTFGVAFTVNTEDLSIEGRTNKGKTLKYEHKKRQPEYVIKIAKEDK
ncbi:MAG: hypothetical protein J6V53_03515 [Alphaproteobacteria bacterium]|nr:hypothetical protein [Alphaproteobacteria bacterium]